MRNAAATVGRRRKTAADANLLSLLSKSRRRFTISDLGPFLPGVAIMSFDRILAIVLLSIGCLAVFIPWSAVGPFTISGAQVGGGLGLVSILAYGCFS